MITLFFTALFWILWPIRVLVFAHTECTFKPHETANRIRTACWILGAIGTVTLGCALGITLGFLLHGMFDWSIAIAWAVYLVEAPIFLLIIAPVNDQLKTHEAHPRDNH